MPGVAPGPVLDGPHTKITDLDVPLPRIALVPARRIELINDFGKQQQIMNTIMLEGGNSPVSRRGTG